MAIRGLGRGLDALLGGSMPQDQEINPAEIQAISLEAIVPNPNQPRRRFDEQALAELAESIKSQGVLQPVLLRPVDDGYELVAGERRFRAAGMAGLTEIPALVREMTDQQSLAIALIENLQREDLNPLEEAQGYRRLLDEFGLSQEDLASSVGKSRSSLANSLRLLKLPDTVQEDLAQGRITAGHARALLSVEDGQGQTALHERMLASPMTVRQAESEAAYYKKHGELPDATAVSAPAASGGSGLRAPRAKSLDQRLADLQESLSTTLGLKVSVSGHVGKGKVVLHYDSEDDLITITSKFGVSIEE